MQKEELIDMISRRTNVNRARVSLVVDELFSTITQVLAANGSVKIVGFGTFEVKKSAARVGRNPHTNEAVPIPARLTPRFKAGVNLKAAVTKPIK